MIREESDWIAIVILTSTAAFAAITFTQDTAKSATDVAVKLREGGLPTVLEVFIPASQADVEVCNDRF